MVSQLVEAWRVCLQEDVKENARVLSTKLARFGEGDERGGRD